ncbi:GATA transcription factor 16-like isoform X1 [Amaranthus tricolor]|uniref:GATA transcription factor 16-like isoform X1 n=1 Tax=Amaranthus tricolor TaxID=29722 RepID=UPI0025836DCE|nr:GATA transcription factor 16-like isoform X1 [Amaranthus tricolor]
MLDLKQCSVSESQSSSFELKRCTDCQTTTTPLWRGGPAGPKTLCNACGIKYHKRRRALLGLEKGKVDKNKKKTTSSNGSSSSSSNNGGLGMPFKIKVIRQSTDNFRDKLGEVEQAAMLLMALSYGSVYA